MKKFGFLTSETKVIINFLKLVFTKKLIFEYYDLKYYIWIKIDLLSYITCDMLSLLSFKISSNKIVIKINLS